MINLPQELRKAIDVARNHHLIEQDEIYTEEDGRQYFERRLKEVVGATPEGNSLLADIPPFTTTCWKTEHPQARAGRITWPWVIA